MEIEYMNGGAVALFQGKRYYLDRTNGYYKRIERNHPQYLHRAVYSAFKGHIPEGWQVHHADGNKGNNEPQNLNLVTDEEHHRIHAEQMSLEDKRRRVRNVVDNAMPQAKAWHRSEAGHEWHKRQFEANRESLIHDAEFKCETCGKVFVARAVGTNRFCSGNCKAAWRRHSGIDNEQRSCSICGRAYVTNKYSKQKTCGIECGRISRKLHQGKSNQEV